MRPMYDVLDPEALNPKNVLTAGSKIQVGMTDYQRDLQLKKNL